MTSGTGGLHGASASCFPGLARFRSRFALHEAKCHVTTGNEGNEQQALFDQRHWRKYSARHALIWDGEGV